MQTKRYNLIFNLSEKTKIKFPKYVDEFSASVLSSYCIQLVELSKKRDTKQNAMQKMVMKMIMFRCFFCEPWNSGTGPRHVHGTTTRLKKKTRISTAAENRSEQKHSRTFA
jgi:hypothetical protein